MEQGVFEGGLVRKRNVTPAERFREDLLCPVVDAQQVLSGYCKLAAQESVDQHTQSSSHRSGPVWAQLSNDTLRAALLPLCCAAAEDQDSRGKQHQA